MVTAQELRELLPESEQDISDEELLDIYSLFKGIAKAIRERVMKDEKDMQNETRHS